MQHYLGNKYKEKKSVNGVIFSEYFYSGVEISDVKPTDIESEL